MTSSSNELQVDQLDGRVRAPCSWLKVSRVADADPAEPRRQDSSAGDGGNTPDGRLLNDPAGVGPRLPIDCTQAFPTDVLPSVSP